MSYLEPFQYHFFQQACINGTFVAVSCGLLGTFVVLRGLAFLAEALAHSVLPGIVVAKALNLPVGFGAWLTSVALAFGMQRVGKVKKIGENTAIGAIYTGVLALGIMFMSRMPGYSAELSGTLFGSIVSVAHTDIILSGVLALLLLGLAVLFFRELALTTFDPDYAQQIGIDVEIFRFVMLLLLATLIVLGAQTVGVVMITALLILPAATARFYVRHLGKMLVLSCIVAIISVLGGLWLSYFIETAPGATIVVVNFTIFLLTWAGYEVALQLDSSKDLSS